MFPLSAFYAHPSTADRLHIWCKNCCRERAARNYKAVGRETGRPKKSPEEAIR